MPIEDKVSTNPEISQASQIVGEALVDLIDRKWGNVVISFSCQNGRIKTLKVNDERIYTFKNDSWLTIWLILLYT